MGVAELLERIQEPWSSRVINRLARGSGVRENFQTQINRFYDSLIQAIEIGDPAWLDPVILDWATSTTVSDLSEGQKNITAILNQIFTITYETARENLSESDALNLFGTILPLFTYALEKVARIEMETRVSYISKELSDIQKRMEQLDKSKSNFISVAAHELKTPLTLIEGYSAMLRDQNKKGPAGQIDVLIDGVYNGITRLRGIIDDMIDVSLIDNKLLSLNFQPIWLGQLLSLLRTELIGSFATRKQIIDLNKFPGSDQMLFADPERIYQAFRNILTNAVKYTPDGGTISIDGRILPGFIEVTISDTGIGIAPESQDRIFEKFGQLGNISLHSSGKTKFKGGGAGLGLPIAKGIIEAHGGTLWAESPGYDESNFPGSTFHILIPMRTEPPDPKYAKLFGVETELGETK